MIDFVEYRFRCAWIYRKAKRTRRAIYWGLSRHGVPCFTMLMAHGREAWQVTQVALEHGFTSRKPE